MPYTSSHASSNDFGPVSSIAIHNLVHQSAQHFCVTVIVANKLEKGIAQQVFNDWSPSGISQLNIRSYFKTWLVLRAHLQSLKSGIT